MGKGPNPLHSLVLINFVLAVVAFAKDLLFANYFGTSAVADAFTLAYFIPDTIGNNLLASALGVAVIPILAKQLLFEEKDDLYRLLKLLFCSLSVVSLLLMGFLYEDRESLMRWFGGGATSSFTGLSEQLLLILSPILLFYPLLSLGGAVMNAAQRFILTALAPVLLNGCMLLTLLWCMGLKLPLLTGSSLLGFSITGGTLVITFFLWLDLHRREVPFPLLYQAEVRRGWSSLKEIMRIFFPYLLILSCTHTIYFVERYLAARLGPGTVAGLNYAFRLSQFPVWVFAAAVTTIVLPSLAKWQAIRDYEQMNKELMQAIKWVSLVVVPFSFLFYFLRVPLVTILFERGAFNQESVHQTAQILAGYALSIAGQSFSLLFQRYFLAIRQMVIPLLGSILFTALTGWLDFQLIHPFGSAGLGYAAAIGASSNSMFLCLVFLWRIGKFTALKRKTFWSA
jgi:putative peptidoglycan lipid II flippase